MPRSRRDWLKTTGGAGALLALPLPRWLDGLHPELRRADRPYLEVARRAAAWIATARLDTEAGVAWAWNPQEVPEEVSTSLYTGTPGVVLFLLELHHATGDEAVLREAVAGARDLATRLPPAPVGEDGLGAGLYTGIAGWAFVLHEAAEAAGDETLRRAAERADRLLLEGARDVGAGAEWSETTDIVSGSAGIALYLLQAWERTGEGAFLETAAAAGRRLVEVGEPSEGGLEWYMSPTRENRYPNFSHGTAGVAYALASLHGATGEPAFLDAALAGARYLEATETRDGGGCKVFHHEPGGRDLYYLSWCHGPAGTARLFRRLEEVTGDARWRDEVACYARAVMASGAPEERSPGYWNNVSQCCGDAGVGEFFLALSAEDPRPEYREMVERVTGRLLREAEDDPGSGGLRWVQAEHRVRPGWTVPQTGFMQGAAGIGTYFLHLDGAAEGRRPRVRWPDSPWGGAA